MAAILIFAIGTMIGSFLNVCIRRLPRSESIIFPGSHCPDCKHAIPWYDNIPLLSYAVLRARCRFCRKAIPFRYFLVELLTGALLTLLFVVFGLSAKFFAYSFLASALIAATFIDLELQVIPDHITYAGLIVGPVFAVLFPAVIGAKARWPGFLNSLAGVFAGALSIYTIGFLGKIAFKKEAMGEGDIYLMAMIGAFLGWKFTMLTFFIAPLFGSVVGLVMKLRYGHDTIPYGPYLSLAALVAVFFGERILSVLFYGIY